MLPELQGFAGDTSGKFLALAQVIESLLSLAATVLWLFIAWRAMQAHESCPAQRSGAPSRPMRLPS